MEVPERRERVCGSLGVSCRRMDRLAGAVPGQGSKTKAAGPTAQPAPRGRHPEESRRAPTCQGGEGGPDPDEMERVRSTLSLPLNGA